MMIIKNGLTNSIGWNLGKKYKSTHLLDPLTSIPMIGTRNKKTTEITKYEKGIALWDHTNTIRFENRSLL